MILIVVMFLKNKTLIALHICKPSKDLPDLPALCSVNKLKTRVRAQSIPGQSYLSTLNKIYFWP